MLKLTFTLAPHVLTGWLFTVNDNNNNDNDCNNIGNNSISSNKKIVIVSISCSKYILNVKVCICRGYCKVLFTSN